MATTSTTPGRAKGTGRKTTTRKTTRRSTARRRPAPTSVSTQKTGIALAGELAERAALVPVGATLLARDNLVSTVRELGTKYRTRASIERELKRFERRGSTARNRFERQVRRNRTSLERQLRQRRNRVQRTVKQNRRRVENEVRTVRKDVEKQSGIVGARVEKLVSDAQGLLSSGF
jgi:hypothetical protein